MYAEVMSSTYVCLTAPDTNITKNGTESQSNRTPCSPVPWFSLLQARHVPGTRRSDQRSKSMVLRLTKRRSKLRTLTNDL